jgi:hypothetical protein
MEDARTCAAFVPRSNRGYTDASAPVAQGIERAPPEREVAGSIPAGRITTNSPRGLLMPCLGMAGQRLPSRHEAWFESSSLEGKDGVLAVIPMQQVTELRNDAPSDRRGVAPSGVPMIAESRRVRLGGRHLAVVDGVGPRPARAVVVVPAWRERRPTRRRREGVVAVDEVVARATRDNVTAEVAPEGVVARIARDVVDAGAAERRVRTLAAGDVVVPAESDQLLVTRPARERVVAADVSGEDIVARASAESIVVVPRSTAGMAARLPRPRSRCRRRGLRSRRRCRPRRR